MMHGENDNNNREQTSYESTNYETPRWQPDPQKYNTGQIYSKPPKKKKTGIIVLIIVIVVLVAIIVAGLTIGSRYVSALINHTSITENTTEIEVPETQEAPSLEDAQSADTGVVWSDVEEETHPSNVVVTDVTAVVDEVFPAVVSITSRTLINDSSYFNFFFGRQGSPYGNEGTQKEVESGLGSGTIIGKTDKELLILTSNHVVEGSSSLAVTFVNGTSIDGVIKAASDDTDIAIVAVPIEDVDEETMSQIKIAKLSSQPAKMGEGVIVIGNPLGYGMSVTTGIVSAVDRELTIDNRTITVLQTDAAINSGNSGGCMLNSKGEVIGISEAKIIISSVEGMCYAIPVSNNMELIQSLLEAETPEREVFDPSETAGGAYLGIRGRDITSELAETYGMPEGVYVISVVTGGGAETSGIVDGDIITAMDGQDTTTMSKLQFELAKHSEGDVVTVTVMRDDGGHYVQADIEVTLTGLIS